MSQTESQDKLGTQLDDLGKEIQSQKSNTRGVSMDFQKLRKFGKTFRESNAAIGINTLKSSSKTLCIRQDELLEWVGAHNSNISPEKEILFQSKQSLKSNFVCNGLGDFTGINRKIDEPMETIKIESDDSVKSVALVSEKPPKWRNVRRFLESKFNSSGISAIPLDEEVTLHPEGDMFPPNGTPVKVKKLWQRNIYHLIILITRFSQARSCRR